jgi:hypothetical protein
MMCCLCFANDPDERDRAGVARFFFFPSSFFLRMLLLLAALAN